MFNAVSLNSNLFWIPDSMGHMIPTLRSCHVKMLFNCLVLYVICVAGITVPGYASAQTENPPIAEEYFVQQAAEESLLIRINAFEAEFESEVGTHEGQVLITSGIPGSRIVPVFQYINAPSKARQLNIEVTSSLHTGRSNFGLEISRQVVWDDRSNSVSRAYQLLSFGMQSSDGDSEANWTVKIDSLVNAGRLFQQFGMKEMRLWSNYLAAHLIQFHLHDHGIVYTMTREILADVKGSRLQKIELAALQLQAGALIGLKRSGSLRASANDPDPIQSVLARTAALAESMGFHFEQAQALNISGAEYVFDLRYTNALEQYQLAVGIADSVGDGDLATSIRESIVQIHAVQGNAPASSEVLKEIETQLVEEGGGDELALNLLAQGRLFIRSYRYNQALETLLQALVYQNNSAIRKQVNFELAKIFYATGRPDVALEYLQMAEVSTGTVQQKRGNSVIDIGEGLAMLANIYRSGNDYAQMRKARSAQGFYKPPQSQYLYEQGMDELATLKMNRSKAQSLFRQSHTAAITAGQKDLQHLSRLQFCALGANGGDTQTLCSKDNTRDSYESLFAGGVPSLSAEAMFLWAKIQVNNGKKSQAIALMDKLADELHLYRHSLPGVLGAWYWERHEQLFEYYLELLVTSDDSVSLLGLSKTRFIEKYSDLEPLPDNNSGDSDLLRIQLAERANSKPGNVSSALIENINRGLSEIRRPFRKKFYFLSKSGLQKYLRSLTNDEIVLTYHISPTTAQVWVGHRGKVLRRKIPGPAYLYPALQEARQGLAYNGISSFDSKMNELGKRLIAPVADLLTETIYWIPAGPLLGFPLDGLKLENRYLVEQHKVVNLLSFPANPSPAASMQTGDLQDIFLAGHPLDYSGDYATRLDTSTEISAVAEIFVGPGLRIVQGAALLPDEFEDPRFQNADLVHLAMPGTINLRYPGQSGLELSGDENGTGHESFMPYNIQTQKLESSLVFLSNTRTVDEPDSGFNNQLALVSDFAGAGAHSVIANLWATGGRAAEAFIKDFYHNLQDSGDVADSLQDAKRVYLKNNRDDGLFDWAGYQLFID
jgi:CHAT domain-containing protein/tetratricopeptide (TPR) repeat protein